MADVKQKTLDNGLVLIGEPRSTSLSCSIGYFVKTGARDEVGPESGVSHFLEHMMFKGTKKRSAMDITFELGNLGAQANAYTSEESTVFYGTIVPEKFQSMQELLSDMLRPSLTQEDFDTEKNVILEEIALYQDKPQFLMFEKSLQAFFADHPAGNSVLGTTQSITDVTREQMASYFERRYSPANMTLVATGNFDWDLFCEDAKNLTKDWKPFEAGRTAKEYQRKEPQSLSFTKEGLNQAHLLLMANGVSSQDDRRYAASILSSILGDSGGSKLYWELVETGLCETCVVDTDEKDNTGAMMVYATTSPDRIEMVKEKIFTLLSDPLSFSDEDLERSKRKMATRVVLSGELPIGRLMAIGNDWLYRGKITSLNEVQQQILNVSRKDLVDYVSNFGINDKSAWSSYTMMAA